MSFEEKVTPRHGASERLEFDTPEDRVDEAVQRLYSTSTDYYFAVWMESGSPTMLRMLTGTLGSAISPVDEHWRQVGACAKELSKLGVSDDEIQAIFEKAGGDFYRDM